MRLLDTSSLELKEFWDNEIPLYAILSHTWEEEEVSFWNMQSGRATSRVAYVKISSSCKQAAVDGLKYIWIDTCCIDKSSRQSSQRLSTLCIDGIKMHKHAMRTYRTY